MNQIVSKFVQVLNCEEVVLSDLDKFEKTVIAGKCYWVDSSGHFVQSISSFIIDIVIKLEVQQNPTITQDSNITVADGRVRGGSTYRHVQETVSKGINLVCEGTLLNFP